MTALAIFLGTTMPPAGAQSVAVDDVDSDVSPYPLSNPQASWTVGGALYVGQSGTGRLAIGDGGTVESTIGYIGHDSGSKGTVTVSGDDSAWSNTYDLDAGLYVAYKGKGTLIIEDRGKVESTISHVGYASGSEGIVTVSGGGSEWTNTAGFSVGHKGKGTLTVDEGGKVFSRAGDIGYDSGSEGAVTVSGPGSTWMNNGFLTVGIDGKGTLTIEDGGTVEDTAGFIGLSSGSEGAVTVTGPGSTWTNTAFGLMVGFEGIGTLTIANGGKVTSPISIIGGSSGSQGIVTVSGSDGAGDASTWAHDGDLYLGDEGKGTLTIGDGGVVSAGNGSGTVYLGARGPGAGILNIGTGSGGAGTLAAEAVQFGDGAAALNFDHEGVTTFSAALQSDGAGAHTIDHLAGTTTLTGDSSSFTGTTTVSGGTLLVGHNGAGALGGTVTVAAGGQLGGTGEIGSIGKTVTIETGGVHAATGAQSVLGDYVNHGTLRIAATPAGAGGIVVAGSVDIRDATLDLLLPPADAAGWNVFNGLLTIIENRGGGEVTGTFARPYANGLLFLDASVAYDGGAGGRDVTLSLARNHMAFASVGRTRNQVATGAAVESLGNADAIWAAIALTAGEDVVRASFDALSGEVHASARGVLVDDSRFLRDAANTRLRAADRAGTSFWTGGFGARGSTGGDGNAAGLDRSTGGLLAGADGLAGDWRLGVLAGYSHAAFAINGRAATGASDNYHFGLYGGTEWGALAFRAGAAYTWHTLSTTRAAAIPGTTDTLVAGYNAGTFQAFGELGYGVDMGDTRLEPFAGLAYIGLRGDGFAEQGGAAALHGRSATTDIAYATLGLRAGQSFALGAIDADLHGMVGWRHALGDVTPATTHGFSTGDAFTIAGAPIAKSSALLEAGLDLDLTPDATLGLSYQGRFTAPAQDHGLKASLNVRF